MTAIEPEEDLPPVAHVVLVYNGPVAPHWEMQVRYGDQKMLDEFWTRVGARLLLLPKHDPQFRRNRERVNRDAERELIICDWDLGEGDAESTITEVVPPPGVVDVEATAEDASSEADIPAEDLSEAAVTDEDVSEAAMTDEETSAEDLVDESAADPVSDEVDETEEDAEPVADSA
jgi:hypothetical protein